MSWDECAPHSECIRSPCHRPYDRRWTGAAKSSAARTDHCFKKPHVTLVRYYAKRSGHHKRRPLRGWCPYRRLSTHPDQLLIDELIGAILAELSSRSRTAWTPPNGSSAPSGATMFRRPSRLNLVGDAVGLIGIDREEVRAEPGTACLRQSDRFFFRADAVDDRDWTEQLLTVGVVVGVYVGSAPSARNCGFASPPATTLAPALMARSS